MPSAATSTLARLPARPPLSVPLCPQPLSPQHGERLGAFFQAAIRSAPLTVLMENGAPLVAFCVTAPEWHRFGRRGGAGEGRV